ncbi:MAG: amidohydrolase family protein [Candidatus Polarisedimenticolia bacterium]
MGALLVPSHLFVLAEALDSLGLLGPHHRFDGLIDEPPARRPAPPLWIAGGLMWDADGGLRGNPGIGCEGGRLVTRRPEGAVEIDAHGLTLLPGLIDMHVHALGGSFDGELMLAHGVTTARDVGSDLSGVLARRDDDAAGRRLGPRLFVTGPYLVAGEEATDQEVSAPGPQQAAATVARLAEAGVDGIKVHGGIDAGTLEAVLSAARERGLWVAAHLETIAASDAARLGVSTIEHASGIDWDGGSIRDDNARDALARSLAATRVAITPTLVVSEHAFTMPRLLDVNDPSLQYFPWLVRRGWIASQLANASAARLSPEEELRRRTRLVRQQRFVARFEAAGGRVLAGSDAPAFLVAHGDGLLRELELLAEAGLTWDAALEAATSEAAAALGRHGDLGTLAPGARADLLLISGDPDRLGIAAIRRTAWVILDGRVVLRRSIDTTIPLQ